MKKISQILLVFLSSYVYGDILTGVLVCEVDDYQTQEVKLGGFKFDVEAQKVYLFGILSGIDLYYTDNLNEEGIRVRPKEGDGKISTLEELFDPNSTIWEQYYLVVLGETRDGPLIAAFSIDVINESRISYKEWGGIAYSKSVLFKVLSYKLIEDQEILPPSVELEQSNGSNRVKIGTKIGLKYSLLISNDFIEWTNYFQGFDSSSEKITSRKLIGDGMIHTFNLPKDDYLFFRIETESY